MRRTKRLLIVGNDDRSREIVKGIQAYCRLHGKWELHWENPAGINGIRHLLVAIRKWKADGIIAHVRRDAVSRLIRRARQPLVNLSGWQREFDLPTVVSDDIAVGRMAARHFLNNGFQNFGFCAKTVEGYVHRMCDGFVRELAEAGCGCNIFTDKFTGQLETDWNKNSRRTVQWLLSLKKPTAILCMYDFRGYELIIACQRLGLRIPDEVAIVGVGNADLCEMCTPPLSSVDVALRKIGYEAIRLLHQLIRGGKAPSKPVLIAPRGVIIRGSSDMIAITDPDISAAVRFIRDHGHEPLRVKEILGHIPISRKMLEIKFQRLLGRSPGEEINRIRMEQAKSLLTETDLSMPAVAKKTGFPRASNFSVFFRREMGMTPTQYRRNRSLSRDESPLHSKDAPYTNGDDSIRKPTDSLRILSREQEQRLNELAASSRPYSRLKPPEMRRIIMAMCQGLFLTAAKLGELLHRNPDGLRNRFLTPMIHEGLLQRKYPDEPSRSDQAYTSNGSVQLGNAR